MQWAEGDLRGGFGVKSLPFMEIILLFLYTSWEETINKEVCCSRTKNVIEILFMEFL